MTVFALALIVCSSVVHATWNLFSKRAGGGLEFTWLFGVVSVVVYTPLAAGIVWLYKPAFGITAVLFMAGSAVLHIAYYGCLQRGYRSGDMSLVYPIARGTSPLLATAAAVLLLGETVTTRSVLGVLLIVGGTFGLTYSARGKTAVARAPILYGIMTGIVIASYTVWDSRAVSAFFVPPLLYDWGCNLLRTVALTPVAFRHRQAVRHQWRTLRKEVIGIGILSPLSYILVLSAMAFTPVSYVAPVRELNILVGTFLGGRLLKEGNMGQRLGAAGLMMVGVILIALS